MNAALLSAVKSVNADHLSFEDRTDSVLPASPEAHTQVGEGRLSRGLIEATGNAMEAEYWHFRMTGDVAALNRAHNHMRRMCWLAGVSTEGAKA